MEKTAKLEVLIRELQEQRTTFQRQTQFYIWDLEEKVRDLKGLPLTSESCPDPRSFLSSMPQPGFAVDAVQETAESFTRTAWEAISVLEGSLDVKSNAENDAVYEAVMEEYLRMYHDYNVEFARVADLWKQVHAYWREHILPFRRTHKLEGEATSS